MSTSAAARLAGEELGELRHVCVLVDGTEDAYSVLMPFIVAGFAAGDRAFHIVDPGRRDDHLQRLIDGGIEVTAATTSHQLEVLTWTESYMRDGRFDRAAQLSLVRHVLGAGADLGFPRTRAFGSMDWAVDPSSAADLIAYETRLDEMVRRLPDIVLCVYDLNRHSARTIADVLGVHPVSVVGGALRTTRAPSSSAARDRLLTAASSMFHEAGIQATGVDALVSAAGVAKATFYRHFPSKDDLVVAWLRDPRTRWLDRIRVEVPDRTADVEERISRFYDAIGDWLESGDFRGCPYLNTGAEITDPGHPARTVVTAYLQEVGDFLEGLLAEAGYRASRQLAASLLALAAGAISLAVARRSRDSVAVAGDAAMLLLATWTRS